MAITDIVGYSHLGAAQVEALGTELDALRRDTERSLGSADANYIRQVIRAQRYLEVASRAAILLSPWRTARWIGTAGLAASKCIENMELGHNITHGQWDWMNDPEIHSNTLGVGHGRPVGAVADRHNYAHHTYTNMLGMDEDSVSVFVRMTRDDGWRPIPPYADRTICCWRRCSTGASRSTTGRSSVTTRAYPAGASRYNSAFVRKSDPAVEPRTTCSTRLWPASAHRAPSRQMSRRT